MTEVLEKYDSTGDTLKHIMRVRDLLDEFCIEMMRRGAVHDASKLGPDEKPYFDEATPRLKNLTYGTEEYKKSLASIRPAIDHHVNNNSHHPEYYANGINGMDLMDLVEMFFDWKAASERVKDGNFLKGLKINQERFEMSDQLTKIFENTARRLGWDERQ